MFLYMYRLNFDSFRQENNADIVKFLNVKLINITNRQNALNGSFMFHKDIVKFDITFLITSIKRNGLPWTLLNVTLDGCDYLKKGSRKNVIFPYVFLSEIRATNPEFPKSCPIAKDKEILLRNFSIQSARVPLNFPEISFYCEVIVRQRMVHRTNFETFRSEYNTDLVKHVNMHLINNTNKQNALDVSFMFNKEIVEFNITFLITSKKANGLPWTLLNLTLNGCEFLKKGSRNYVKFPYIFLSEIHASNPDFPKKCPLEKVASYYLYLIDKEIFFKNFSVQSISLNFPEIDYHCEVITRQRNGHIFTLFIDGSSDKQTK
ncbi:hypothetical protein FF38_07681 [Lucilia cuprina]|uniref:Uncharacterized protein n=1 Tax=Lucilia cuprina TaxID=7375 RepID=A0A0L0CHA4_LUCCU|nr:hypothetical protein FF38_07681 [Lucilia cuprina]